jgi:hypothetical protein
VTDPALDTLLGDWASSRLRRWAAAELAFEREAILAPEVLARAGIPTWPSLVAFERRFGGVRAGRACWGLGAWLRRPRPLCATGGVARINASYSLWDPTDERARGPDDPGTSIIVLVHDVDLDTGIYCDEAGALFTVDARSGTAYPTATTMEHLLEQAALAAEILAARRATDTGDFFVEIDGELGSALATRLSLPPVPEASDAISTHWWDGAVAIADRVKFGDPTQRATRIASGDLARLRVAARLAYGLANRGRKRPRQPRVAPSTPERVVRIIGWPNAHTYGFARALAHERGVAIETVTTYP